MVKGQIMGILKKKLLIYGLGSNFKYFFNDRVQRELRRDFDIIGLVDKDENTFEKVEKYPCFKSIPPLVIDCICITSEQFYTEIKAQLIGEGVREEIILPINFLRQFYINIYLPVHLIKGKGAEVGGPSDIFEAIYNLEIVCDGINYQSETIWGDFSDLQYQWKGRNLGKQIIADATDMHIIADNTYDFVLSSNNLEHIANPLKAVYEMLRILKRGGLFLLLVPCKRYTFDCRREDTTFDHLLEDYKNNVTEDDLSHLPEILEKHVVERDDGIKSLDDFQKRSLNNYKNRCIHHHVFSNEILKEIAEYFKLDILENTEFHYNHYLLARKRK